MDNIAQEAELWRRNRKYVVDRFWSDLLRSQLEWQTESEYITSALEYGVTLKLDMAYTIIMFHLHPYNGQGARLSERQTQDIFYREIQIFETAQFSELPLILLDQRIYATVCGIAQKDILQKKLLRFKENCKQRVNSAITVQGGDACSICALHEEAERMQYSFRNYIAHEGEDIPTEPLVNRVKQYIAFHLDQPLTRSEIAKLFFISPEYLSRTFKMHEGISLTDYITASKMETAAQMLQDSEAQIYQAAARLGYHNFSYFSKAFKKHYHISPAGYRKQHLQKECRNGE